MDVRSTVTTLVVRMMLGLSCAAVPALADETVSPKSESIPSPAPVAPPPPTPPPVQPKPRAQEGDTKPPLKAQSPGVQADGARRETVPVKPEPGPAPAPSKPKLQEGESKIGRAHV